MDGFGIFFNWYIDNPNQINPIISPTMLPAIVLYKPSPILGDPSKKRGNPTNPFPKFIGQAIKSSIQCEKVINPRIVPLRKSLLTMPVIMLTPKDQIAPIKSPCVHTGEARADSGLKMPGKERISRNIAQNIKSERENLGALRLEITATAK